MADHYRKAVELLEEAEDFRLELDQAYKAGNRPKTVADLHDRIRFALKRAEIHSNLALAQASFEKGLVL